MITMLLVISFDQRSTAQQNRKGLIKFLVKEMNEKLEVQEREVTEAEFVDLDDKALMQCFTLNSSNTGINGVLLQLRRAVVTVNRAFVCYA